MKHLRSVAFSFAVLGAGCGGEAPLDISFQAHALTCTPQQEVEARLDVLGIAEPCFLDVDSRNMAQGTCERIPTGAVRDLRLSYFVRFSGRVVELASVVTQIDLRGETREVIDVDFPAIELDTRKDDDGDGASNLEEVCRGDNPLMQDS